MPYYVTIFLFALCLLLFAIVCSEILHQYNRYKRNKRVTSRPITLADLYMHEARVNNLLKRVQ